jgi:hypothetical protein
MIFVEAFRPGWLRVGLSLIPAYSLGWVIGPVVYNLSICWRGGGTDCAAYSPTGIGLSYLLSWPIFLLGSLLEKFRVNFDVGSLHPVAPEFVLLWLYYYLLVSTADHLTRRRKMSGNPAARNNFGLPVIW